MNNSKTKSLAIAAILLAVCIASQFFKNLSVYITGPIVNTCLILCVLAAGLGYAIFLSIITPVTAFLITGSPIMAAIPLIIPCVMLGNIILVAVINLIYAKKKTKTALLISTLAASVAKALFMGISISLIIIPTMLPEAMLAKKAVFQTTFSLTQLITAVIGGIFACIIWPRITKRHWDCP